jgi:predicted metal-dependent peptidase
MKPRLELTEAEHDFYRLMLYRVTSSSDYGQPFLRRAFFRLIPAAVNGTKTMSIDANWCVYIDFDEMMARGADYASGILNHEIWHPLRHHHEAAERLPPAPLGYQKEKLINYAADLEINDDIKDLLPLHAIAPGRSVFRDFKPGQTLDVYYLQMLEDLEAIADEYPVEADNKPPEQNPESDDQKQQPSSDESEKNESQETEEDSEGEPEGELKPEDTGEASEDEGEQGSQENDGQPSEEDKPDSEGDGSSDSDSEQSDSESGSPDDSKSGQSGSEEGNEEEGSGSNPGEGSESGESEPDDGSSLGSSPSSSHGDIDSDPSGKGSGSSEGQPAEPDFWDNPSCGASVNAPEGYELNESELTETEEEDLIRKVAEDIKEYEEELKSQGKGVGSGGGGLMSKVSKWADQQLKTKPVPWKQQLRGQFMAAVAAERGKLLYVRNKLSRRQPVPDILFPGLRAPNPTIGLAIDVSGSNLGNLKTILVEVGVLMRAAGAKSRDVKAFAVDVKASETKYVSDPMKLLDNVPKGGGTRMAPGYRQLAELGQDISILITDGYVDDYPSKRPQGRKRTKFITCIIMDENAKNADKLISKAEAKMGSWSKVIAIKTSKSAR